MHGIIASPPGGLTKTARGLWLARRCVTQGMRALAETRSTGLWERPVTTAVQTSAP